MTEKSKRSVLEVQEFVGWPYLEDLVKKAAGKRNKGLVATMFETGGRVTEVLALRKNQFSIDSIAGKKHVVVTAMKCLKKFHKEKLVDDQGQPVIDPDSGKAKTRTVKDPTYRTFSFPIKEPLVTPMMQHIRRLQPTQKLFNLTRQGVWHILVKEIDPNIWAHWFRSQRASQLAHEYGFDVHALMEWFGWQDINTALRYSRLGYRKVGAMMVR